MVSISSLNYNAAMSKAINAKENTFLKEETNNFPCI